MTRAVGGLKTKQTWGGYTLVELVAVLAILAILTLMVMPLAQTGWRAKNEADLRVALWQIRDAIDMYSAAKKSAQPNVLDNAAFYPKDLTELTKGVLYAPPGGAATTIYPLRRIPRDPFADPALSPEKTWRLRSYTSPANNPQAGGEVFDVRSSSSETALDGSRYEDW